MNFNQATTEQLQQIAMTEDCNIDYKYKAAKQLQIRFVISKYRKGSTENNFNPTLSKYWKQMYYSLFKRWE